jgi:hypothetical protein
MIRYFFIIFFIILSQKFQGVGVYDLRARRLVGFEETDGSKEYKYLHFKNKSYLIIFLQTSSRYLSKSNIME